VVSHSIAQLVDGANRRLADRGKGSLRLDVSGRRLLLRGSAVRDASTLIEAGAAVFDVRAAAEGLGVRVEVAFAGEKAPEEIAPGGVPTVWATLTLHPRTLGREPVDVVWPAGPRVLASGRTAQQLSARELVAACERGAASEGVSARVSPMPLPDYFGLVLRAHGDEQAAWFALGQAWAGIERLAGRCGWVAHLRLGSTTVPPVRTAPWFSAQVEVWVLRRAGASALGSTPIGTDDWFGL
jgi:hypothetical protein